MHQRLQDQTALPSQKPPRAIIDQRDCGQGLRGCTSQESILGSPYEKVQCPNHWSKANTYSTLCHAYLFTLDDLEKGWYAVMRLKMITSAHALLIVFQLSSTDAQENSDSEKSSNIYVGQDRYHGVTTWMIKQVFHLILHIRPFFSKFHDSGYRPPLAQTKNFKFNLYCITDRKAKYPIH